MLYDVIDAETGEIYVDTGLTADASKFLADYQCQIVSAPECVSNDMRGPGYIYVIPNKEVK